MANTRTETIKEMVVRIWTKDMERGPSAIVELCEEYRRKYAHWADVELYHAAAGSTPRGPLPHEDFPGDDSVLKRLQRILDTL